MNLVSFIFVKTTKDKGIKGFMLQDNQWEDYLAQIGLVLLLTEVAVFGYRAGKNAAEYAKKIKNNFDESNFENHYIRFFGLLNNTGKQKAYNLKLDLQKKSWDFIGAARKKKNLILMQSYLEKLEKKVKDIFIPSEMVWNQQLIETIELQNVLSAKSVTMASLNRDFSLEDM